MSMMSIESIGWNGSSFWSNQIVTSNCQPTESENAELFSDDSATEVKKNNAQQFLMEASQNYANQMSSIMGKISDEMQLAQEIYRRIASGAKVSQADEQTLMNYDSKMYMAAKNAQMMAERHEDLPNESLTEQFEEKHANDRTDWTTELENRISELNLGPTISNNDGVQTTETPVTYSSNASVATTQDSSNIDILI